MTVVLVCWTSWIWPSLTSSWVTSLHIQFPGALLYGQNTTIMHSLVKNFANSWSNYMLHIKIFYSNVFWQATWIGITMRRLRSLEMKPSLFTLTMEEGRISDIKHTIILQAFIVRKHQIFLYVIKIHNTILSLSISVPRFGKHSHDEVSILAPLSQCCRSVCSTFVLHLSMTLEYS